MMRYTWLFVLIATLVGGSAGANESGERWQLAESHEEGEFPLSLFVEAERRAGRPAFKIETSFGVSPYVAAVTLMDGMVSGSDLPKGQRRRILERSDREALVYTFIDLPFILSDRELALRIVHAEDPETGAHRVDWLEANEVLPPVEGRVVRLEGTNGYWEFRPDGRGGALATHMTQTEIGGSFPAALANRLMKAQAIDSVERLRRNIRERQRTHVAGSPPGWEAERSRE